MSKEAFKVFVSENPSLAKYVNNNSMTWQKFYEMYELYGSNNTVWNTYLEGNDIANRATNKINSAESTFKELMSVIKGINLEKVQKGIDSIQKTISLVQELGSGSNNSNNYEQRPIYKKFED